MKLAMAASVARDNEMLVRGEDFAKVSTLLLDAEVVMPEIFKEMHVSKDKKDIEALKIFLFSYCKTFHVGEVPEHKLVQYMTERIPVNRVDFFIDAMLTAQHMKAVGMNVTGHRRFVPIHTTLHKEEKKK